MPYAAMLLVVLFWGSAAAVGRSMGDVGTPLELALWRVALGLSLLLIALAAAHAIRRFAYVRQQAGIFARESTVGRKSTETDDNDYMNRKGGSDISALFRPSMRRLFPIWIGGVLGYGIMIWLFFAAARTTLASHLVLILSMAPICTMLLDRLTGGRGDSRSFMPAIVSLAGIVIMVAPSLGYQGDNGHGASLTGDLLAILALLAFSAYTVITKRYSHGLSTLSVNVHGMSAGLLVLWLLLAFAEGQLLPTAFSRQEQWLAIGYLGFASTGLAYLLYAWALSRMPMERIMPLIYLQPMVGVLLSVVWLGEELTHSVTLGMCGIVGGLFWNHRYTRIPAQPVNKEELS